MFFALTHFFAYDVHCTIILFLTFFHDFGGVFEATRYGEGVAGLVLSHEYVGFQQAGRPQKSGKGVFSVFGAFYTLEATCSSLPLMFLLRLLTPHAPRRVLLEDYSVFGRSYTIDV